MLTPHRRPPVPPEHPPPPPSDGVLEHVVADLRRRSVADLAAGRTELARSRADMADALALLIPPPPPAPGAAPTGGPPERHRLEPPMIFTRAYWTAAVERALSAGAASATAGVSLDALDGLDLDTWRTLAITFAVGAVFSLVKGLAANATNGGLGPGLGSAEVTAPAVALPTEDGEQRGGTDRPAAEVVVDDGTPTPESGRAVGTTLTETAAPADAATTTTSTAAAAPVLEVVPTPAQLPADAAPGLPMTLMGDDIDGTQLVPVVEDAATDADREHATEVGEVGPAGPTGGQEATR